MLAAYRSAPCVLYTLRPPDVQIQVDTIHPPMGTIINLLVASVKRKIRGLHTNKDVQLFRYLNWVSHIVYDNRGERCTCTSPAFLVPNSEFLSIVQWPLILYSVIVYLLLKKKIERIKANLQIQLRSWIYLKTHWKARDIMYIKAKLVVTIKNKKYIYSRKLKIQW